MSLARRTFLSGAATAMAFTGFARAQQAEGIELSAAQIQADPYRNEVAGYGPLRPDPAGLFDLPAGFSYTIISEAGRTMSDGLVTPQNMDGMACFRLDRRRVVLVRNHELRANPAMGPFGPNSEFLSRIPADRLYDRTQDGAPFVGGTTSLVYDLKTRRVETEHLSLVGTAINCAGGPTPWGSWLSCEETTMVPGGPEGARKAHGWVFEVPSSLRGMADPQPITGMGRFKHEATATDPRTGITYLTEDLTDGLFYRFLPNDRRRPLAGGRLQALGFREGPEADPRNRGARWWSQADWKDVVWVDLEGVDNPHDDLRNRGAAAGAARFARGEGIFLEDGELYFTCTNGGVGRLGQVMRYRPSPAEGRPGEKDRPGRLQLFIEPTDKTTMEMADNLAVAPWGHLILCEDKTVGANYLRGATPSGQLYTIGRNAKGTGAGRGVNTELAGCCFSPDGSVLFLNLYGPGTTLAITGPWRTFRAR